MEERWLNTWEEFERALREIRMQHGLSDDQLKSSLLFRGQEDANWPLRTTLDRTRERMLFADYYGVITRVKPQIETLTGNQWPIPDYPQVRIDVQDYDRFSMDLWCGRCPGYAYMAYLRHHGFPSPLLDWTRSPYVAAFFAFSKALTEPNSRVAIYVLSEINNKPSGNKMAVLHRYGPYVKSHRRHVLQQSEYTLCTNFDEGAFRFEKYDTIFEKGRHQQGMCWKLTLPASERPGVLRVLDEYNLNAFSLFETEDSMMQMLAVREFDFERIGVSA